MHSLIFAVNSVLAVLVVASFPWRGLVSSHPGIARRLSHDHVATVDRRRYEMAVLAVSLCTVDLLLFPCWQTAIRFVAWLMCATAIRNQHRPARRREPR